ncbi:MAG: chemotaxis protein CheW [Pseudomonadota bacterium]|jgi:purine-binding chemotaxis protein CheW|uniref:Chemotaxis protein CheW n=2 Tax=Methylophaga TaxID=40222 RepID=F5SZW7_9GAMM|nr:MULTISPECIES: chemotaxis protein CheW [Methylophaga]MEC9413331.1 chemotaxis protein CheW [Pseudomonadota bacterium]EGL54745.1 chemotaxis signal transduction protein [Methylophaga aminisulfidivorans MP]WVI85912.1 chemotaxis protein CheW [Methylophaga thalassica]GLQ01092.1 chemotaxis protein CheW [Methylophaga thalassica]HIC46523.1 purine-binding chemotaxis protein CheW [Methylophaga sp.]
MSEITTENEILDILDVVDSVDDGAQQYLTFELADEHYGVEILRVQEIKGWDNVTPIPNTPAHVCGVLNLRGVIVPIVDLRLLFQMPFNPYTKTTVVVVLKVEGITDRVVGIVVDAVSEAQNVDPQMISNAPDLGTVVDTSFIKGITSNDEYMLMLLDIDKLLSVEQVG